MGKIDQAHDAEQQADAKRGQRVQAAEAQGIDDVLYDVLHAK